MSEIEAVRWPWWMTPARVIGRMRPALLATAQADAMVFARLPRVVRVAVIPLIVFGIAAAFAGLHAFTTGFEPALPLNWLRFHMANIYTEVPLFIIAASLIGAFSPSAAVMFVLSFGSLDLVAAAMHPEELNISAVRPFPIVGRLVAYWLLWVVAVEVPVLGRTLGLSLPRLARSRLAVAVLVGAMTGAFTLIWTLAAAALIRPVYVWSDIGGPYAEGFVPLQNGGMVFALVAGAAAGLLALWRGPGRLLTSVRARPPATLTRQGSLHAVAVIARRLLVAALLTIALGGLILTPLDAAVVFVAIAGAGPLARLIARRLPFGTVTDRLPPVLRIAAAIALVTAVSFFLVYAPILRSVSEFFSVIVVMAVGLFVMELVTAQGSAQSRHSPSLARAGGVGALLALALLGLTVLAPEPALADNGASLQDLWAVFDAAVLGAAATPVLIWMANRARPPSDNPFILSSHVFDDPTVEAYSDSTGTHSRYAHSPGPDERPTAPDFPYFDGVDHRGDGQ